MVDALREMHEVKYVHRDVKLENFLIKGDTIKIIDFGLSSEFQKAGQPHVLHQTMGGFQGTLIFASINTLYDFNGFRRDDLESLGYSIMFLIDKDKVPWRGLDNK